MAKKPDVFNLQLAMMLASDGFVRVSKVGRTFVMKSRKNKATVPQTLAREMLTAFMVAKKTKR